MFNSSTFLIANPAKDGLREGCTTLAQIDRINGKLPKYPLLGYYDEIDKVSLISPFFICILDQKTVSVFSTTGIDCVVLASECYNFHKYIQSSLTDVCNLLC